ncbi:MAG: MogA/MoaB family molybdenum cofactor biosynthesis protein [Thermoplasmata archaeon]
MGAEEHKKRAMRNVRCAVITVSDTRNKETDASGKEIMSILQSHGHVIARYEVIKDEPSQIADIMRQCIEAPDIQAVIFNGGTGISARDNTIETLSNFSERALPGFGELFRMLSYEEIGAAAMLSRATAFIVEKKAVFCLPGSTAAVKLATEKLIAPELGHLLSEANR